MGATGQHSIMGAAEVRVGRDPVLCPVHLEEPRVSGVHATLKFENSELWVRDENSNNGTHVGGTRVGASVWTPVPNGALLRFGPVEFTTRYEA
ncbi:MAG: FHA domain-containing protein [Polyangiaceae bacterium]